MAIVELTQSALKMIKLAITSKIPENFGEVLKAEVWPSDKVREVIERTCRSTNIKYDSRMFMTLGDGTPLNSAFPVGNYIVKRYAKVCENGPDNNQHQVGTFMEFSNYTPIGCQERDGPLP